MSGRRWRRVCALAAILAGETVACIPRELAPDSSTGGGEAGPPADSATPGPDASGSDGAIVPTLNACGGKKALPELGLACGECRTLACAGPSTTRCAYTPGPGCPAFRDETGAAGLLRTGSALLEDSGQGAGVGDFDGDGVLDIVHAGALTAVFYRGDAAGAATFTDYTSLFGLGGAIAGNGVVPVDVDDDGDLDLTLTSPPLLGGLSFWRNVGGVFFDDSAFTGLSVPDGANGAAWGDYDGDGDLDLYVATFEQDDGSHLFRNDGGSFTDVTVAAGVTLYGARSFQPAWLDADLDGDLDLLVANDIPHLTLVTTTLFRNDGDGTFTDWSAPAGVALWIDAMGIAIGDPDLDGDPDVYITNVAGVPIPTVNNVLFMNDGGGSFSNEAGPRGAGVARWAWGDVFFDYDNDGDEDLFFAAEPWSPLPENGCVLLENGGTGFFTDVSAEAGADVEPDTFGALAADFDGDGALDLLLTGRGGAAAPLTLLMNNGNPGRWLAVRLDAGAGPNRHGIGARIRVTAGEKTQTRWLAAGESIHSGGPPVAHFGMGWAPLAETVEVTWPDGVVTVLADVALDQTIVVTR